MANQHSWKQSFTDVLQNMFNKNFAEFTGKHLGQSLLFRPKCLQLYLKRDSGTGVSFEFCETYKNTFLYNTPVAGSALSKSEAYTEP